MLRSCAAPRSRGRSAVATTHLPTLVPLRPTSAGMGTSKAQVAHGLNMMPTTRSAVTFTSAPVVNDVLRLGEFGDQSMRTALRKRNSRTALRSRFMMDPLSILGKRKDRNGARSAVRTILASTNRIWGDVMRSTRALATAVGLLFVMPMHSVGPSATLVSAPTPSVNQRLSGCFFRRVTWRF